MIVVCTIQSESKPGRISWHSVVLEDEISDKHNTNIPHEVREKSTTTAPYLHKVLDNVRWCFKHQHGCGQRFGSPFSAYLLQKYIELSDGPMANPVS